MNASRAKWLIAIFLAVLVAGFIALRYLPARGVQQQLQSIRSAGLPASSRELDAWYKTVSAGENQALLISEAAKYVVEPAKRSDPTADLDLGHPISSAQEALINAYLTTNQPALQLLQGISQKRESRYPIDLTQGPNTLLPHLAQVKRLAILLRVKATAQSHAGNPAGAVSTLDTSFALARSLSAEPLLISDLVRIACVSITLHPLERLLSEHPLTAQQLSELSQDVADAEVNGPRALFRALVGERAGGLSVYQLSFGELERLGSGSTGANVNPIQNIGYHLYRASGLLQRDMALYLEMMGGFVDSSRLEFPDVLQRFQQGEAHMTERFSSGLGRFAVLSRMLLPALSKAAQKEAALSARLRCAEVALAVESYRRDHLEQLPDSLDQLAPDYLHKLPRDPFDGSPLLLERRPDRGYRVIAPAATKTAPANQARSKNTEEVQFSVLR